MDDAVVVAAAAAVAGPIDEAGSGWDLMAMVHLKAVEVGVELVGEKALTTNHPFVESVVEEDQVVGQVVGQGFLYPTEALQREQVLH